MSRVICNKCGTALSSPVKFCSNCGEELWRKRRRRRGSKLGTVIAGGPAFFGLLLVVAMVMWLLYDAARGGTKYEPTQAERDAYAEEQLEELGLDEAEFIKPQR